MLHAVHDAFCTARHAHAVLVRGQQLSGRRPCTAARDDRSQTVEQLAHGDGAQAVAVRLADGHEPTGQQVLPGRVGDGAIENVLQQRDDAETAEVGLDQRGQQPARPAGRTCGAAVVAAPDDALDLIAVQVSRCVEENQREQIQTENFPTLATVSSIAARQISALGHGSLKCAS